VPRGIDVEVNRNSTRSKVIYSKHRAYYISPEIIKNQNFPNWPAIRLVQCW